MCLKEPKERNSHCKGPEMKTFCAFKTAGKKRDWKSAQGRGVIDELTVTGHILATA